MSRRTRRSSFSAAKTEGGLLPDDLLVQVAALDPELQGLKSTDYHLAEHERLGDEINGAWTKLLGYWHAYQEAIADLSENEPTTRLTRERWLLPLFKELDYGRLPSGMSIEVEGKKLAVSHGWSNSPIHLLGDGISLDKKQKGVRGAARTSPHGLVQAFLNRSDDHLWGFVSNGETLRLLRDHHSLTRQAYVEFDLQSIMEGELYSEFMLLWLVCHQSRVEAKKPEDCWLEKWFQQAREEGVRALDHLRDGVEAAITTFGVGFLKHRDNKALREALQSGELDKQDYYRQLLRLVYRLIFIFVAEDRDALLDSKGDEKAKKLYERFYSTKRLRDLAGKRRGSPHRDLWESLRLVMRKLGRGCPELAIPALGSFLWSDGATPWLDKSECDNEHLLEGLRNLCWLRHGRVRYPVNWKNIGADELGSVYESLLELHPSLEPLSGRFQLASEAGSERKTTGSYYTPSSLVGKLLDSALDPLLYAASRQADAESRLLGIRICDPACGSGHFLVAAARRIAKALAAVRVSETEPSPQEVQQATRDVVGRCLYGVDLNPMAVELCKISLWLEAVEGGPPLSFLDSHIVVGNALLGATPTLMCDGVPNDALKPLDGDSKEVATRVRKRNREERKGIRDMFSNWVREQATSLAPGFLSIDAGGDESLPEILAKQEAWATLQGSPEYKQAKLTADAWCAAFVLPLASDEDDALAVTHGAFGEIARGSGSAALRKRIADHAEELRFFHWHLAFPHVFAPNGDSSPGFDVVLGNPPWDSVEFKDKEWFASRAPEIAQARTAAQRKRMIAALATTQADLFERYRAEVRAVANVAALVRHTGRFPLTAKGKLNTYRLFAELSTTLTSSAGVAGILIPTGIATDDTSKTFFSKLIAEERLHSLHSFENEEFLFPAVHHAMKFCLLVAGGSNTATEVDYVFFARQVRDLEDQDRHFKLAGTDISLMNPNTKTCPTFRWRRDANINRAIYGHVPVLLNETAEDGNPWRLSFRQGLFNTASDSNLFNSAADLLGRGGTPEGNTFLLEQEVFLPLIEAKMVHQFDHRFGSYRDQTPAQARQGKLPESTDEQHSDPHFVTLPRHWVARTQVQSRLEGRWERSWLVGWRDICRSVDRRTTIAAIVPLAAVADTFLLAFSELEDYRLFSMLPACLSSYALDYAARQKVGGTHLKYHTFRQLPVPSPSHFATPTPWHPARTHLDWFFTRYLELVFTAFDLSDWARDVGYSGAPFKWDAGRRFALESELNAGFFHMYGISREDVDYVLESFWVVREAEQKHYGKYRTKDQILAIYDRMQAAIDSGKPYETLLDPPPADPSLCHPPRDAAKTGKGS